MATNGSGSSDPILAEVIPRVEALFCAKGAPRGGYERSGDSVETVYPGVLYRFPMIHDRTQPVTIQIYYGLEEKKIASALWEKEVRVLLRVGGTGHAALPRIHDGGFDRKSNLAYVVTESSDYDLSHNDALGYLRQHRTTSLRRFIMLCDALSVLHRQGLTHRHLAPRAIQLQIEGEDAEEGNFRLRLARFEMSTLISDLGRRLTRQDRDRDRAADQLAGRLASGREMIYSPPERFGFLAADAEQDKFETERSDVYGLGVLAWELFVGEIPDSLLQAAEAGGENDQGWMAQLKDHLRITLEAAPLPIAFKEIIRGMIETDQKSRSYSGEVVNELSRHYHVILSAFEPQREDVLPRLIAFDPDKGDRTLAKWGMITSDPNSPEAERETVELYEREELRNARLLYSPEGAVPYVTGSSEVEKAAAKYVLVGSKCVYFCRIYEDRRALGGRQKLDEILYIRFPALRNTVRGLEDGQFHRPIGDVQAIPASIGRAEMDNLRKQPGRLNWKPLLKSVEVYSPKPEWRVHLEQAYDFLLDFQEVELEARTYPFQVVAGVRQTELERPGNVHLKYDEEADRSRIHAFRTTLGNDTTMFGHYAYTGRWRRAFGDFFLDIDKSQESYSLEFCEGARGRPKWSSSTGKVVFVKRRAADRIEVYCKEGRLPSQGWLRVTDDRGTFHGLQRQREARGEAFENHTLLSQLHEPKSIRGIQSRWRKAGSSLRGDAPKHIRAMLSSQVLFALQGPPGTGKTTVAAHAIEAFLREERGARLLVTAQSNHALDNLALRIRKQLNISAEANKDRHAPLAIRVASAQREEAVHTAMQDLLLDELTDREVKRMTVDCQQRLKRATDTDEVRRILGQWLAKLPELHLEIQDRIRRGANITFSTCLAATRQNLGVDKKLGGFDWVIVEEAAKAWLTEVAIPLVRGTRWTLIGDHKQLSAHRSEEVARILAEFEDSEQDDLRRHSELREKYARFFDYFGSLFASESKERPVRKLLLQFRMRQAIGDLVSQCFYEGTLETDPSTRVDSGLTEPACLKGKSLVWIDTADDEDCVDSGWYNEGEAAVVADLLRQMHFVPNDENRMQEAVLHKLTSGKSYRLADLLRRTSDEGDKDDEFLAVLTPYLKQIDTLLKHDLPDGCRRVLSSVHAFQGRQANVVVASLVRSERRGESPAKAIGYLVQPEIANVLFSRAKRLLIIVGKFQHFKTCGVPFWSDVCDEVERRGERISLARVRGDE